MTPEELTRKTDKLILSFIMDNLICDEDYAALLDIARERIYAHMLSDEQCNNMAAYEEAIRHKLVFD